MTRYPHRFHASVTPGADELTGRFDMEAVHATLQPPQPSPEEVKAVTAPDLLKTFGFND